MQFTDKSRLPLALLVAQAFFLGIALFASYTASNTLFLMNFNAKTMPYVFVVTALMTFSISYGLAELRKSWSYTKVALSIIAGFGCLYFVAWFGFSIAFDGRLAFSVIVIHQMWWSLSGVALGMLAGAILDVRQLKRWFPTVLAAQALAVPLGSLLLPSVARLVGPTENLLLVAGGSTLLFGVIGMVTTRRFAEPALRTQSKKDPKRAKSFFQLLKKRYIVFIVAYQVLAVMEGRLVEYLFASQAQNQFTTPEELTRFFSNFYGATQLAAFVFSMFVAGHLLRQFGLSFGLTARAWVMAALLLLSVVVSALLGPSAALVFWLIVGVRFLDLGSASMSGAVVRTGLQALPEEERIEGVGGPIAYGVTGILLIILNSTSGITLLHIVLFTFCLVALWGAIGLWVYRDYARTIVQTLSRRALGQAELSLADSSSLAVVERLLRSDNLRNVCLALDLLEQSDRSAMAVQLISLVEHSSGDIQVEALRRIASHRLLTALPAVTTCLETEQSSSVKGAALRAFCALAGTDALSRVVPYLDEPELAVRLAALVGLLHHGSSAGRLAAGERLVALAQAPDPAQRTLAAQVIGETGLDTHAQTLLLLLQDQCLGVRTAALLAAQRTPHPRVLACLIENLADPTTRSAAMAALTASGDLLLPVVDKALTAATTQDREMLHRLIRVCGQIKGPGVVALLKQHINHADAKLQHQVLLALHSCTYRAGGEDRVLVDVALRSCAGHGLRLLLARREIGESIATAPLHLALREEFNATRQRVFLLLSFCYDAHTCRRVEERLAQGSTSERALAIETLDVTLSGAQKELVLPLVDESMALAQRIKALSERIPLTSLDQQARLAEIITDTTQWSHSWTRACAIYAAGKLTLRDLTKAIEQALTIDEQPVPETVAWALANRVEPVT